MNARASNISQVKVIRLFAAITAWALMVIPVCAADQGPVGPRLTPKLGELIIQEMQFVLQASSEIHAAIVTGDHETVAIQAMKVHDSFIMKRSLTEQDQQDLMNAVPPAFIALDAKLHETAAKLAHAAEQKDSELETVFFAKMTETCVTCHSAYATDRFPALSTSVAPQH